MTGQTQHQFNNTWGQLCSGGLHILIGTGVDGKPLNSRVQHSLSQLALLEKEIGNEESSTLLNRINARMGRLPGQAWNDLTPAITKLDDRELRMLARDLADFFLVTYAEERDSKRAPNDDVLQIF